MRWDADNCSGVLPRWRYSTPRRNGASSRERWLRGFATIPPALKSQRRDRWPLLACKRRDPELVMRTQRFLEGMRGLLTESPYGIGGASEISFQKSCKVQTNPKYKDSVKNLGLRR